MGDKKVAQKTFEWSQNNSFRSNTTSSEYFCMRTYE